MPDAKMQPLTDKDWLNIMRVEVNQLRRSLDEIKALATDPQGPRITCVQIATAAALAIGRKVAFEHADGSVTYESGYLEDAELEALSRPA